jgi:4-amino-4-deoxy-L-arabinose transferase-like glycosyltransferase
MTDRTKLLLVQMALVLGVCGFFFFFGLGAFGLVGADEPRYAQIAREMFARHDWIVPTLNGAPWLEKPVLLYWKVMNSYSLFGVHDWAARIPSAVHATTLVLAIFFFMRRFRFGGELDAALITASSAGMIGFARGASTDMLISAPFALAMLSWWTWHETGKKLWLAGFYVLLAVGALAKGPVAPALAVLVVAAYAVLRREGKIFVRSLWLPGFLLFFAIAAPWYFAVQSKVPQFFHAFFVEQNLQRFGTNLYRHSQPFWYYIPVLLLTTLPWTIFAVVAMVDAGKQCFTRARARTHSDEASEVTTPEASPDWLPCFLLFWIAVAVVFFSISRSKLPGYILPAIPAAAILTADYLRRSAVISRLKVSLHALLCGVLLVAALMAPFAMVKQQPSAAIQIVVTIAGAVIAAMVMLMVRRQGPRVLHFVTLVPTILAVAFLLRPAAPVIDQVQSARAVQERLVQLGASNGPVAVFNVRRDVAYGLNFYRNQPISHYESDGPPDLPSGIPPEKHIVVTKEGNEDAIQALVGDRQVLRLGGFPQQHLEFFRVAGER